ncbi:MAG: hypothetical protein Q8L10_01700 [Candidatus Moranbacteria bacterium]|nr:hypothetical protein [Candidatus Moranbacteria bacterium]
MIQAKRETATPNIHPTNFRKTNRTQAIQVISGSFDMPGQTSPSSMGVFAAITALDVGEFTGVA